jgi:electron transfer flavoprotein-quinone oxidoreductase
MKEEFDAIIVGAGPAGCAAALSLARSGLSVLLIERGRFAGSKNVTGGVLYGAALNELVPEYWKEAPVERRVTRHVVTLLSEKTALSLDFDSKGLEQTQNSGFTVLRARFDRWFAGKVEEAGGMVITGIPVDDLLWDGPRIVGVVAGGDKIPAPVVIAADGVNSTIAKKAGLEVHLTPTNVNQGVKEIIKMPNQVIEERFNLTGDTGAAIHFLGYCTQGVHGGGFIYTNKDTISLGVVVQLQALINSQLQSVALLEGFKEHPSVMPLIKDGTTVEYSAHLVPAGGLGMVPQLCANGLLVTGDAAGLVLATGRSLEGLNFAVASGMAAAETAKLARQKGDYSKETLSQYSNRLAKSFVMRDLKRFERSARFLENRRIYDVYPELACGLAEKVFTVDGSEKKTVWQLAVEEMKGKVSTWQLIRDAMAARKAL